MKVVKRDGTVVPFDQTKIEKAIRKAFEATGRPTYRRAEENIVERVARTFTALTASGENVGIERIQDEVESVLMGSGFEDVAKAYILYREDRSRLRKKRTREHPDSSSLSNYIHYSKYARYLPDKQRRETYLETSHRCRDMHLRRFCHFESSPSIEGWVVGEYKDLGQSIQQVFDNIMWAWDFVDAKRVLPSMRSMQFGGKAIEDQNARIYNCCFTYIDRPRVFQEIFYLLLCGCGVGFSVQQLHISKLPKIKKRDTKLLRHHTIEDSIIGWADSIGILLASFFSGYYVEFSYSDIRHQGAPLHISGGKAPGHLPLKRLHTIITNLLSDIHDRQLRSIECHDIICHIADSVLSGGIRRSSLISLFSPDDEEMLYAKHPDNFEHYGKNGQRALANNSAVLLRKDGWGSNVSNLKDQFLKIMELNRTNPNGEPGFFFTNNFDYGCNPCGEIGLNPVLHERYTTEITDLDRLRIESGVAFCNLTEVNCAAIKTEEEFYDAVRAATIIGTLQAAYTDMPYLGRVSEQIAKRDALLGVSLTGIMDNPGIVLNPDIQRQGVITAKITNREITDMIGINEAKRITTVKPSGTASLLLGGVSSGIHPHHSKRYFRRITANINEPIVRQIIAVNPQMVEYKPNGDLSLVFPIEVPSSGITLDSISALDFLDKVFSTYENWVSLGTIDTSEDLTHNISCTVCFKPKEYDDMVAKVWENRDKIAALSFIPHLSDKLLPFMPREAVSDEKDEILWNKLVQDYTPIDYKSVKETESSQNDLTMEVACARGEDECGVISVKVEDSVVLLPNSVCRNMDWAKWENLGCIEDSFDQKLVKVRRK